ncbi:MAG: hypothetical protein ACJAY2_000342 [Pseudomonadales bacterium]|jgi:hypothetical protein
MNVSNIPVADQSTTVRFLINTAPLIIIIIIIIKLKTYSSTCKEANGKVSNHLIAKNEECAEDPSMLLVLPDASHCDKD